MSTAAVAAAPVAEKRRGEGLTATALLAPATIFVALCLLAPLAILFRYSLNEFIPTKKMMVEAVTVENYVKFFTDPYYTSIPFFYHCRTDAQPVQMSGFFIDNGYKANFEFCERDVYRYRFSGGQYTEYVFSGPGNLFESYAPRVDPRTFVHRLGEEYEVCNTIIKKWSTGGPIQSPLKSF